MSFLDDRRFVRIYLAVGLAAVLTYHWTSRDPHWFAYELIGLYGGVGAVVGASRQNGADRRPWLVFAAGVLLLVCGDLAWDVQNMLYGEPGSPSAADAFYLVAYPTTLLGLVLLTRRITGSVRGNILDTLIVALSLATVLWPFMFATFLHGGQTIGQRLTAGVYPVFDLIMIAFAVRIALSRTMHPRRNIMLVGSVALFLVGDLFWFQSINTYVLGNWEDYAWLSAYIGWGATALHPKTIDREELPEVAPFRRFALLGVTIPFLPAAVVFGVTRNHSTAYIDGALISVVLLLLLCRFGALLRGLDDARRELREQNRLKDELISVVSHDLRTPLTSIMGYLELALAADTDPQEARHFLEVVQRNTGRLHRLVEDLLFVSRVQAGKDALTMEVVEIGEIARATVAAALPAADAAEVRLECEVACADETLGDEHRITEVLENLLSNALKFTPPGGTVNLGVHRVEEAVLIRVSDTGVGIAPDDQRHLFDRFFRAAGTDGVPGAGLGLSIVKAIVDAHGGRIRVQSRVGAGTTFEVEMPLVAVEAPTAVPAAA